MNFGNLLTLRARQTLLATLPFLGVAQLAFDHPGAALTAVVGGMALLIFVLRETFETRKTSANKVETRLARLEAKVGKASAVVAPPSKPTALATAEPVVCATTEYSDIPTTKKVIATRCKEKTARANVYLNFQAAQKVANQVNASRLDKSRPVEVYLCGACGRHHIGKSNGMLGVAK